MPCKKASTKGHPGEARHGEPGFSVATDSRSVKRLVAPIIQETSGVGLSMNKDQNTSENLDSAYREMAQDEEREAEALEWAEAMIGDVGELAENSNSQSAE